MGLPHILAVIRARLMLVFAALFLAQPALSQQPEVPEQPPSLLAALAFNTVRVRTTYDTGFGLIVARRGNDLLVVTAGHVVVDEAGEVANAVEVTLLVDEHGGTSTASGTVQPPGLIGADGDDLAFILVTPAAPQPLVTAGLPAAPAERGDLLWILNGGQGQWSDRPGRVELVDGPNVVMTGGGASRGDSGSPLVGYGGVYGILVETTGPGATIRSMDRVKAVFDEHFAADWQWTLQAVPPVRRIGWVRLRRADDLSSRFIANIVLHNDTYEVGVFPDLWLQVPVGTYRVQVAQVGTTRPDIACDVSSIDVVAYVRRDLNLVCRADPSGEWVMEDGYVLRVEPAMAGRFPLTVIGPGGVQVGSGTAQLRDNRFMTLTVTDTMMGSWVAETELSTGVARGRVDLLERHVQRDFAINRR